MRQGSGPNATSGNNARVLIKSVFIFWRPVNLVFMYVYRSADQCPALYSERNLSMDKNGLKPARGGEQKTKRPADEWAQLLLGALKESVLGRVAPLDLVSCVAVYASPTFTGELCATLKGRVFLGSGTDQPRPVVALPDGHVLVPVDAFHYAVWNTETGQQETVLAAHETHLVGPVTALTTDKIVMASAVARTGSMPAKEGFLLSVYNRTTGRSLSSRFVEFPSAWSVTAIVTVTPTRVALALKRHKPPYSRLGVDIPRWRGSTMHAKSDAIVVYDLAESTVVWEMANHSQWVRSLSKLTNGPLVSMGCECKKMAWDPETGKNTHTWRAPAFGSGVPIHRVEVIDGFDANCIATWPSRAMVILSVFNSKTPVFISVAKSGLDSIQAVRFLPDGRIVGICCKKETVGTSHYLCIWDMDKSKCVITKKTRITTGRADKLAILADGKVLTYSTQPLSTMLVWK